MQYLTVPQPPEAYIFRKTKLISLYGTFQNPHLLISKFTLFNSSPVLSDASLCYTLVFLFKVESGWPLSLVFAVCSSYSREARKMVTTESGTQRCPGSICSQARTHHT